MNISEAQGWGFLIASLAAAVLSLRNGWKLKEVHDLTNSRLKRIEEELSATKTLLDASRAATETAERSRVALAAVTAVVVATGAAPLPLGGT